MSDQELIIAVAKLDGNKIVIEHGSPPDPSDFWTQNYIKSLKYLTSYDAILPVIQKQDDVIKTRMFVLLEANVKYITAERFISELTMKILTMSPRQLTLALVRATTEGTV